MSDRLSRLDRAKQTYAALEAEAVDGVFTGHWMEVVRNVCPPVQPTAYVRVRQDLTDTGCIIFLQRGNRRRPSRIKLDHPPVRTAKLAQDLRGVSNADSVRREVANLSQLLGGTSVPDLAIALIERLDSIERRLQQLESNTRKSNPK